MGCDHYRVRGCFFPPGRPPFGGGASIRRTVARLIGHDKGAKNAIDTAGGFGTWGGCVIVADRCGDHGVIGAALAAWFEVVVVSSAAVRVHQDQSSLIQLGQ